MTAGAFLIISDRFEHWLQHVAMAMGVDMNAGESVVWKDVPGYPVLLKAFLLEVKARPVHLWPESMVACMCVLVT